VQSFTLAVLLEMGVASALAEHASQLYPDDASQAYEFCESHQTQGMTQEEFESKLASTSRAESIGAALVATLKAAGFAATLASGKEGGSEQVSLDREDEGREKLYVSLARRRYATRVALPQHHLETAKEQYVRRALEALPSREVRVFDFRIRADRYVNACFWLSIIAGWSRCPLQRYEEDALNILAEDVHALRTQELMALSSRHPRGMDCIGMLAHRLRTLVCSERGYMRRSDQLRVWAPAFAGLQAVAVSGSVASFGDYKRWLQRVSEHEFADELVLAATAQFIRVAVTTIPYTPPTAKDPWRISSHPAPGTPLAMGFSPDQQIVLGNDDIHYVLVAP
jgi:hypothetical protein